MAVLHKAQGLLQNLLVLAHGDLLPSLQGAEDPLLRRSEGLVAPEPGIEAVIGPQQPEEIVHLRPGLLPGQDAHRLFLPAQERKLRLGEQGTTPVEIIAICIQLPGGGVQGSVFLRRLRQEPGKGVSLPRRAAGGEQQRQG